MRLYHHTAPCNLARIFSERYLWAAVSEQNNWSSGGMPVIWLTAKPDDIFCTEEDRESFRSKGGNDLARREYCYAGCPDHSGMARITIKISNRRKRAVVPYYEWMDSVRFMTVSEGGEHVRMTSDLMRKTAPSPRPEHWWLCFKNIPVHWIDAVQPVGEPSPEYLRIAEWLQTDQSAPPPVLHEEESGGGIDKEK